MSKPKTITSWSPSRLSTYNQCPRKAKYKFVDKLKEPSGPAAQRGTDIHATLEAFVKGEADKVHSAIKDGYMRTWKTLYRLREKFAKGKVQVELEVAVDKEWRPTSYDYENPDVWARFKLDILESMSKTKMHVLDWKSGKLKPGGTYDDQLNAYSTAALTVLPDIKEVQTTLAFVDHDEIIARPAGHMKREQLELNQKKWAIAVRPMMNDTVFRESPSTLCGWCHFAKAKGGPCRF